MNYYIEYTVLCHKGLVRSKNQDNFWCMGKFLDSENDGLTEPIVVTIDSKSFPAFAVFDGMGGEQQGEVAAYIAACSFENIYKENSKNDVEQFLLDACTNMNEAICEHIEEQHLRSSGSTVAILMFGKKDIYVCNIGDSRIYQFSDEKLTQISHDHSEIGITNRKASLTQNLGIPKTEFMITPYLAKGSYENRDKYLICSDGLTDMVSEDEIAKTMIANSKIAESAEMLLQKALESGGSDNITLILCEIRKARTKTVQFLTCCLWSMFPISLIVCKSGGKGWRFQMKILGWLLTLLGSNGLTAALVARNSIRYDAGNLAESLVERATEFLEAEDFLGALILPLVESSSENLVEMLGVDQEFVRMIDTLYYISIGVLAIGIVLLVIGYIRVARAKTRP